MFGYLNMLSVQTSWINDDNYSPLLSFRRVSEGIFKEMQAWLCPCKWYIIFNYCSNPLILRDELGNSFYSKLRDTIYKSTGRIPPKLVDMVHFPFYVQSDFHLVKMLEKPLEFYRSKGLVCFLIYILWDNASSLPQCFSLCTQLVWCYKHYFTQ